MDVASEMTASLGWCSFGVDAESHSTTTFLRVIAFTRHVTLAVINSLGADLVIAEALSTILGSSNAESSGITVCSTFVVGDFVLSDVSELDASENSVLGISVAALVRPASWSIGSGS